MFFFLQFGGYLVDEEREDGDFLHAIRIKYINKVYYEHLDKGWIIGNVDLFRRIVYKNIKWGEIEITLSELVKW